MLAGEEFKSIRIDKGYTVKGYCTVSQITPTQLVYLENGKKSFLELRIKKVNSMFYTLNIDIMQFFMKYYPEIKDNININKKLIDDGKKRECSYSRIKEKFKNRLAKIKSRNKNEAKFLELEKKCNKVLNEIDNIIIDDYVNVEIYNNYILKLDSYIRIFNDDKLDQNVNSTVNKLLYMIYESGYTIAEISSILGISKRRFCSILNGKGKSSDIDSLGIDIGISLCLLFDIGYEFLFEEELCRQC